MSFLDFATPVKCYLYSGSSIRFSGGCIIASMKILKNKSVRIIIIVILLIGVVIFVFAVKEALYISQAHTTFEGYYTFRGCVQLLQKTPDYGLCKVNTGETIKIVKFRGEWYLDGDLPICLDNICF
jgi:hypothetical protein